MCDTNSMTPDSTRNSVSTSITPRCSTVSVLYLFLYWFACFFSRPARYKTYFSLYRTAGNSEPPQSFVIHISHVNPISWEHSLIMSSSQCGAAALAPRIHLSSRPPWDGKFAAACRPGYSLVELLAPAR